MTLVVLYIVARLFKIERTAEIVRHVVDKLGKAALFVMKTKESHTTMRDTTAIVKLHGHPRRVQDELQLVCRCAIPCLESCKAVLKI